MPNISTPNSTSAQNTQSLFGSYLAPYFDWAQQHDLFPQAQLAYYTLGLDATFKSLVNMTTLVAEFTAKDSVTILRGWKDNPLAKDLLKFATAAKADDFIRRNFPAVGHSSSAENTRKQFPEIEKSTYVLTMMVNPLSSTSDAKLMLIRRMLRLWLTIQDCERLVQHNYHGDTAISHACRFLILGSNASEEWQFIDKLAHRIDLSLTQYEPSFEACTAAIATAADFLRNIAGQPLQQKYRNFLNRLCDIAAGNISRPVHQNIATVKDLPVFKLLRKPELILPEQDIIGVVLDNPPTNDDDSEDYGDDQEPLSLVSIDPTLNEAQALVASRSIFLQSAEEAHYLPWSWNSIIPWEKDLWQDWLTQQLRSNNKVDVLGAAFCWLATHSERTLTFVTKFQISDNPEKEWTISTDFKTLSKRVLRRQNAWQPSEKTKNLVELSATQFSFEIPVEVQSVLYKASSTLTFTPLSLLDLWLSQSQGSVESWFNQALPEELSRLTSGKLAAYLPQQIFEKTGDPHLSRVLAAHPNTGLPGACGYASWDIKAIEKGIDIPLSGELAQLPDSTPVLGSLLIALESELYRRISTANQALTAPSTLVEFHNRISQYVVAALYAATGCRHLQDPFERLSYFDLDDGFVYINDKSDDAIHDGRLVPLPTAAIQIMQDYVRHLERLKMRIHPVHSYLAEQIQNLLNKTDANIPLFFQLNDSLQWKQMSDKNVPAANLFSWDLPKNLFRHRYSQQLQKQNVNIEIIDGWMGHAERNVLSYSDQSPRCWLTDVKNNRLALEATFNALPFVLELPAISETHSLSISNTTQVPFKPVLFGEKLRQIERRIAFNKAIKSAKLEISNFIKDRPMTHLSEEEMQQLVTKMLTRDGQCGHHFAAVRLRVLRKEITRQGADKRSIMKRYPAPEKNFHSVLKASSAQALKKLAALKSWASSIVTRSHSRSKVTSLILGVFLLCIHKRISYTKLLLDILKVRNFRLVQHTNQLFIEYSEDLESTDRYAAVQRHEINYQIACLLDDALSSRNTVDFEKGFDIPELLALKSLFCISPETSVEALIISIADIINQANLIDLPGMVAAILSGRIITSSMPIQDQLRIVSNAIKSYPIQSDTNDHFSSDWTNALSGKTAETRDYILASNTKAFRIDIQKILNDYTISSARNYAKSLEQLCGDYEGRISSSILLVGRWLVSVIQRGKGRGKTFIPFAASTISTYFGSIYTAFEHFAYNVNLIALDEDEITDLYSDMIEYKIANEKQVGYFGDRLQKFQRFVTQFGVPDPDWSELNITDDSRHVRPGLITERDYIKCLKRIRNQKNNPEQALLLGFVLLLGYRFGLRCNEALGLRASDWCKHQNKYWVLIRNNKFRKLKSKKSQRAVPLLFRLHELEHQVIEQINTRYQSIAGTDKSHLILCEVKNGSIAPNEIIPIISPSLISIMREITGSTNLVFHHTRHAFHNRLASILFGIKSASSSGLIKDLNIEAIRKMVLGPNNDVSRRSSMALARLMGHLHPSTGMVSYNHLLLEWADQLTPLPKMKTYRIDSAFNTDSMLKYQPPTGNSLPVITFEKPTLLRILKTLRMVSLGRTFEQAGALHMLSPSIVEQIKSVFIHANHKMIFNKRKAEGKISGKDHPTALIEYITDKAWLRLLTVVSELSEDHFEQFHELPSFELLPSLVGPERQLLMESACHIDLVKRVLNTFGVKPVHFRIAASNNNEFIAGLLKNHGFEVETIKKSRTGTFAIDPFDEYEGTEIISSRNRYGALAIVRNKQDCLRNSHELAIAYLSYAVADHLSKI